MFKLQGVSPLSELTLADAFGALMEPGTIVAVPYAEYDSHHHQERKMSIGVIAKVKHSAVDVAIISNDPTSTKHFIRQQFPQNLINIEATIAGTNQALHDRLRNSTNQCIDRRWPGETAGRKFAVFTVNEEKTITGDRWIHNHKPRQGVDSIAVLEIFGSTTKAIDDAVRNINAQGWFTSAGVLLDPTKPVYRNRSTSSGNKWWGSQGYFNQKNKLLSTKVAADCGLIDYVNHVMSLDEYNNIVNMYNPEIAISPGDFYVK